MVLEFTKMNGAGNDFVLIDNRAQTLRLTPEQIVRLCDRHRGVGADGAIILVPSKSGKTDWAWDFYNNDGSVGEMCGNGARCFARFVQKKTGSNRDFTFETGAGVITAHFEGERVTVNLTTPQGLRLNEQVPLSTGQQTVHSLNTGVPHAVLFVPDADKAMIQQVGPEVRRHSHFAPRGTNVNFVQLLEPGRIRVRTYERGVEDETYSCGTGVTASALVCYHNDNGFNRVEVQTKGGELSVEYDKIGDSYKNVWLNGPAVKVFEGSLEI